MNKIEEIITQKASDFNTCFVFPSSVCAKEWMIAALDLTPYNSLPADMFIAWDDFKKEYFIGKGKAISTNTKKLFVNKLLEKKKYNFTSINWLSNTLSHLKELEEKYSDYQKNSSSKIDEVEELLKLKTDYKDFLNENNLYEPASCENFENKDKKFIIFYPDLLEDFYRYENILLNSKQVEFITINNNMNNKFETLEFKTSIDEIEYCMSQIEQALDSGIQPNEIAVNVCNQEELHAYLLRTFEIRDIPFNVHYAKPINSYPIAQIFYSLHEVVKNHWDYNSVKKLFLNKHIPFSNDYKINQILEFGIEYNCITSYKENENWKNIWLDSFSKAKNRDKISEKSKKYYSELESYFTSFYKLTEKLIASENFSELLKNYYTFQDNFLNKKTLNEKTKNNEILGKGINLIKELSELETQHPQLKTKAPYNLFLNILEKTNIVLREENTGINILPYKVSAGSPLKKQFILNMGEKFSNVTNSPLNFLSIDIRKKLNIKDENLSSNFFSAYKNSSDESTYFSYAKQTFSSYTNIHNNLQAVSPECIPPQNKLKYTKERKSYEAFLKNFAIAQKEPKKFSFLNSKFPSNAIPELNELIKEKFTYNNKTKISATNLTSFYQSSVDFFLEKVLNIEPYNTSPEFSSNINLGNFYHKVAERLYTEIEQTDKSFKADKLQKYKDLAEKIINDEIKQNNEKNYKFADSSISFIKRTGLMIISQLLDYDSEIYTGYSFPELESEFCIEDENNELYYKGKIDRLAYNRNNEKLSITDYKKSTMPSITGCSYDQNNGMKDFQMAMYVYLIENGKKIIKDENKKYITVDKGFSEDAKIDRVGFYNLKESEESLVINDSVKRNRKPRESFQLSLEELKKYAIKFKKAIEELDFSKKDFVDDESNENSKYKNISRTEFIVEGE